LRFDISDMIHLLTSKIEFPDPRTAEPDGLLAVGGDLKPERLLLAYKLGIFPWFNEDEFPMWFSPHKRFVLFPEKLRISKSMQQVIRSKKFSVSVDEDFSAVVKNCAQSKRKGQGGTWITSGMMEAYKELHAMGHAHSVEVREAGELAGGLYGVAVGHSPGSRVFCGESMFSKKNNASKLALIHLATKMNYALIDCQVFTPHLERMGAEHITREEYERFLPPNDGK
jgi:leucyl/phenylalanyl-tRNA--protein transferase